MHPTSERLFREKAVPFFKTGMKVLEMGPDMIPSTYLTLLIAAGVDVDWFCADLATRTDLPLDRRVQMPGEFCLDTPDETFDVVFHGQVLEHVRAPWRFVAETARVLKTGGVMVVIMPAAWEYHATPVDCWRAYPEGLKALFADTGLRVELAEWFLVDPGNNNGQADSIIIGRK